jgi:hypothetical protein
MSVSEKEAAHGTKQEIIERIKIFLATGKTDDRKAKTNPSVRDSQKPITPQTKVIHYKNDAATRKFFIEHIGSHFHFNSYLRQFASESPNNDNKILTYGDLIAGWKKSETIKKDPNYKTEIENQFEYNQFIRDFFNNENGKTIKDAIAAWNFIKNKPGKRDYQHYKKSIL